jgi:hypothetical protein
MATRVSTATVGTTDGEAAFARTGGAGEHPGRRPTTPARTRRRDERLRVMAERVARLGLVVKQVSGDVIRSTG